MRKVKPKLKKKKAKIKTKKPAKQESIKDIHGRFKPGCSGNPKGRPKGISFMDEFLLAKNIVEKKNRKSLLVHFIERAFVDNRVLTSCIDRILPALKAVQLEGGVDIMSEETACTIRDKLLNRFDNGKNKKKKRC